MPAREQRRNPSEGRTEFAKQRRFVTLGEVTTPSQFTFRPLVRGDLTLVLSWLAREHVAPFWPTPEDPEEEFFPREDPVEFFVAQLDSRQVGLVQHYRWDDYPDEAATIGAQPGEVGLDYLIGEPDLIGRGLGPAMLSAFLAGHVDAAATGIRTNVATANRRSWRCLEKLGFRRDGPARELPGEDGPQYVYVLDR
jgi:aminoglycoside 6'-N-acetyltransferase